MPYYLQASCEISEDYFLTDQVTLGTTNDLVLPFTSPDGSVEAVVLAGGGLSHLRRDPTQTSGWSYDTIDTSQVMLTSGPVTTAAIQGDGNGNVVLLSAQLVNGVPGIVLYSVDGNGNWSPLQDGSFNFPGPPPASILSGLSPDGTIYFYSWDDTGVFTLYYLDDGFEETDQITSFQGTSFIDARLLWNASYPQSGRAGAMVILDDNDNLTWYPQSGFESFDTGSPFDLGPSETQVSALVWAGLPEDPTQDFPNAVFQDNEQNLFYSNENGDPQILFNDTGTMGPGTMAVWRVDSMFGFAYRDTTNTINLITQYQDSPTSVATTDPIPLQGDVQGMYCQPTDASEATLFVVDVDLNLNVLAKDPTGVWSLTPIHQTSEQFVELTSWRVLVRVLDQNDTVVPLANVQLTASQTIGCWQVTGNTVLSPTPTTFSADLGGRLTFSIPTIELDTAQLTAQAVNPDNSLGPSFPITPNSDVNNFLNGGSSLPDTGKLTGTALLAAQNSDGTPLLTGLTSLPSSSQATAAGYVAGAMSHVMNLGQGATPTDLNGTQSALFDMTGSSPDFQTSPNPNAYDDLMAIEGISDWWNSVKNDAESVWHALRHGVIKFTKMVTNWANDAKNWTINLFVDIGDGLTHAITWVIQAAKDAIHSISSFFHALGADLQQAWDWLKHNILQLIRNAEKNAAVVEGWLDQVGTQFGTIVSNTEAFAANFFQGLETKVTTELGDLATDFELAAFGTSVPMPQPSSDTGSNSTDTILKDIGEAVKIIHYVDGQWLLDKLLDHLHLSTGGESGPTFTVDVNPLLLKLANTLTDAVDTIEAVGNLLFTTYQDVFASKDAYSATTIADFFGDLNQVIVDVLKLADDLANDLLTLLQTALTVFQELLDYNLVGSDSTFGKLLSVLGISVDLSVKHIVALAAAFPATLVYGIVGGNQLFPTTDDEVDDAAARIADVIGGGAVDLWGTILNFLSFAVQGIWSVADTFEDGALISPDSGSKPPEVPEWLNYIDIVAPVALGILQWPSKPVNDKTPQPFSPVNVDGPDGAMIPFFQILGILPAVANFAQSLIAIPPTGNYDPNSSLAKNFQPYVQFVSSIGAIILTSIWNFSNDQTANTKAIGILGDLSYFLAPLGTDYIKEATEEISIAVKILGDIAGNVGTVVGFFVGGLAAAGVK